MIGYKDKINIDYNYGTKLKENEIAFAIYCNVFDVDITDFCNYIYYILSLGNWISKNKHISMYIVYSNLDILGLEDKKTYNKVIYIKCEDINNENINVNNFRKMYDYRENSKTIPSTEYSINNIDNIIYGCYERKLDKEAELNPYCSDLEDNSNLLKKDIFIRVEEIFAKENYKKNLLNLYHLLNKYQIYAYAGFAYNIIMNNAIENYDITNIINEKFKTNLDSSSLKSYEIKNHIDAIKEIFKSIYDDKLTDELIDELKKYLSEIKNKLGSYIKLYLIEEKSGTNKSKSVNPFYINFGTWCIIYQNAILIISSGSDE